MAADEDDHPQSAGDADGAQRARRARAPVTIDLEAKVLGSTPADKAGEPPPAGPDVPPADPPPAEAAAPPPADELPPPSAPPPLMGAAPVGGLALFTAGFAGALVALLVALALAYAGLLPMRESAPAIDALAKANGAETALAMLDGRVKALEAASSNSAKVAAAETASLKTAADALTERVAALEGDLAPLSERIVALEAKPAPVAPPAQPASPPTAADMGSVLDDLAARLDKLEGESDHTVEPEAVTGLAERVVALEGTVETLSQRLDGLTAKAPAESAAARSARVIGMALLREASKGSAPFASELAVAGTLGLDPADLANLKPLAEKGVASRADLAAAFSAVADKILAAADTADPDAGVLARLMARAKNLVSVRPVGPVAGSDPGAVVSRMAAAVARGDVARALAEREALPEPARLVSSVWAASAEDRVTVDKLVDRIAAAAAGG
jgi:hypothetical protein